MKTKLTLSLFFILFHLSVSAQTQINVLKKPEWNMRSSYDSKYGTKTDLSGNTVAMIVDVDKADFGVVALSNTFTQKWLTELTGFPMAIGKFNKNILVIASTDRNYFKSFTNEFKAFILEEKTGKVISQKVIYQGNSDFVEAPDFFMAEDGSYFKMAIRLTGLKRKVHIGLPIIGFLSMLKMDKDYNESQSYHMIDFNNQLDQIQKIEPDMPDGDIWNAFCSKDGSFIITAADASKSKLNVATYQSNSPVPLKTISIPIDAINQNDISSISYANSKNPLVNYIGICYKDLNKERSSLIARVDFSNGTYSSNKEIFNKQHINELQKSFVPANKKFDNLTFSDSKSMNIGHMEEFNDKLLVTISPKSTQFGMQGASASEGSVLMNVYDANLKPLYHQFLPRDYVSTPMKEGSEVSFHLKDNILHILANQKDGMMSVATMYAEMHIQTGEISKISLLSKKDIKNSYYANTESISWLNDSFVVPFVEHMRLLTKKVDIQLLQLKY